jgi:hypothetical protein
MAKKLRVVVTQGDIYSGIRMVRDRCGCPIWQALNRLLRMRLDGSENGYALRFDGWKEVMVGKALRIKLPPKAVKWQHEAAEAAEEGNVCAVKPITFDATVEVKL